MYIFCGFCIIKGEKNEEIVKAFDKKEFEKEIASGAKPHLENLKLDEQQLKTSYTLDHEMVELNFFLSKEDKMTVPIDFTFTFDMIDVMVNQRMKPQVDLQLYQYSYKIGSREIHRCSDPFVHCVFQSMAQESAFISDKLHIHVLRTQARSAVSKYILEPIQKIQATLTTMKKALRLPAKAIVPTFIKLFPLQTFQDIVGR
ncbi:hypothetical protein RFI_20421, partial [Reticulomyxa filosa]